MFLLGGGLVLAVFLQAVSCGPPSNLPPQCRGPPTGVEERPHDCCKIPPMFKEEDFSACGFKKRDDPENKPPKGDHPHGPRDCTKEICLMKKYNLVKDDDSLDKDAIVAFIDKFAEDNPDFLPGIEIAKERCMGQSIPGPPQVCEPQRLVFCISSTIFTECPKWEETEGCTALKKHMEECKPHFLQN